MYTNHAYGNQVVARTKKLLQPQVLTAEDFGGNVVDMFQYSADKKVVCKKVITKLLDATSTFQNMDQAALSAAILSHDIPLRKFEAGSMLLEDWEGDCNNFFVLVHGKLVVIKHEEEIAKIEKIESFGVMGYLTGVRNGTVLASTDCVVLSMKREFIESLPVKEQATLYKNIAAETSHLIASSNEERQSRWLPVRKTQTVEDKLRALGI